MQAFIYRHGQSQAGSNKQQTGIERARQKSTQINRRDRRTISKGLDRRGNPGTRAIIQSRCKQSPNGKAKG